MDAKTLRKQIRNVLQETSKELLATETGELVEKKLLESMNARLDQIDKYCQSSLDRQDKRAKSIQTFLIQTVQGQFQNDLFNATVTVDAVVAVLAASGLNIEDFAAKVDAQKLIIAEERKRRADEEMKAEMERRAAEGSKPSEDSQPEQNA